MDGDTERQWRNSADLIARRRNNRNGMQDASCRAQDEINNVPFEDEAAHFDARKKLSKLRIRRRKKMASAGG
jgi:hypothetical protein